MKIINQLFQKLLLTKTNQFIKILSKEGKTTCNYYFNDVAKRTKSSVTNEPTREFFLFRVKRFFSVWPNARQSESEGIAVNSIYMWSRDIYYWQKLIKVRLIILIKVEVKVDDMNTENKQKKHCLY